MSLINSRKGFNSLPRIPLEKSKPENPLIKGKRGPLRGPCKTCGILFRSYGTKIFCSMKCYQISPGFQKRIREQAMAASQSQRVRAGFSELGRLKKECLNCKTPFFVKPTEMRKRKYCSTLCYRQWMAERFDRWIANPESIALPQCYDEFLTADELPCLIAGCDWRGKELGNHVNAAHGIVAKEFKQLAGFNLGTGLISADLNRILSKSKLEMRPWENNISWGSKRGKFEHRSSFKSLEGKEHASKARMILTASGPNGKFRPCRYCGKSIEQSWQGSRFYCNKQCCKDHQKIKNRAVAEFICDWCGSIFSGSYYQKLNREKGKSVFCDIYCRQARNAVVGNEKRIATRQRNALQKKEMVEADMKLVQGK